MILLPILTEEKLQIGKAQAESLCEIRSLENKLAEIKKEFKNKIEAHVMIVDQTSEILQSGKKPVRKNLPAFLDISTMQKHFVDLNTGEIISTVRATEEDVQINLLQ